MSTLIKDGQVNFERFQPFFCSILRIELNFSDFLEHTQMKKDSCIVLWDLEIYSRETAFKSFLKYIA